MKIMLLIIFTQNVNANARQILFQVIYQVLFRVSRQATTIPIIQRIICYQYFFPQYGSQIIIYFFPQLQQRIFLFEIDFTVHSFFSNLNSHFIIRNKIYSSRYNDSFYPQMNFLLKIFSYFIHENFFNQQHQLLFFSNRNSVFSYWNKGILLQLYYYFSYKNNILTTATPFLEHNITQRFLLPFRTQLLYYQK